MPGGPEWLWIVLVIVVVFGASRLPTIGRNFGIGIKEFKKGIKEASSEGRDEAAQSQQPAAEEPKAEPR